MGAMGARAWRKRVGWCWNIKPAITPDGVVHHTLMADGTYMAHGWCLLIAIDGQTGQVIDRQWCHQENTAAYTALFSRIPGPDVLITDGLRGVQKACHACWPGTRIQRCLVHVQRNTKTDLTLKPRLQAGKELKRLSDQLTRVHTIEEAVRWGEALNAWHERWKTLIDERTMAKDDPANPKASHQSLVVDPPGTPPLLPQARTPLPRQAALRLPGTRTHRRRASGTHHQPAGRRSQPTHQTHPPATPRPTREPHETRLRMALLHENRQPRPRQPDQGRTPPATTSTQTGNQTGTGRARTLRHRHQLERVPHTSQIPQHHTLTNTQPNPHTEPKTTRLVPIGLFHASIVQDNCLATQSTM